MVQWHMPPGPGRVVGQRYAVVRPLGRGGMASTYLVRDTLLDRQLTLKLLELEGPVALGLFRDEFARLSGAYHPRLIEVVDFGSERDERGAHHFYSAQYVEGATLDRYTIARPWTEIARPLCDAVQALGFLHALGIRHGDFKPQNIIVRRDGRATLIDLGCAAPLGESDPRGLSGTPAYLAPELLAGGSGDGRADLYSVGVVIDELSRRMLGELPNDVRRLAARLTARDVDGRPTEAAEVLELLGDREPVRAAPRGRAAGLVGRDREIMRFEACLEGLLARGAGPRALWLHGPGGIGKSRLVMQMKWAAELRTRVVEGLAHAPGAMVSLLARASGRGDLPGGVAGAIDAHELLARRDEGLVLVIDDADALDGADREALEALLRSLAPSDPVLVVCAAREPSPVASDVLENLRIEPLAPGELAAWARGWVSERRLADLHARTGGVPGRVESILAEIATGRRLETELGDASRRGAPLGRPALGTGQAGLELADLGSLERRALGLLVVLGRPVVEAHWLDEVAPATLAALCAAGWLRREASGWRLGSAVDAAALSTDLGEALLRELAGHVADVLVARLPRAVDALQSDLAASALEQLVAAGRWRDAERLFLRWSDVAEHGAPTWSRVAAPLARQSTHPDVLLVLAALHHLGERPADGVGVLARLSRREPARRRDPLVCYLAAACLHSLARSRRALVYLDRALQALEGDALPAATTELALRQPVWRLPRSELRVRVVELCARVHLGRGDYQRAMDLAEHELAAGRIGAPNASLSQTLGVAASYLGRVGVARAELERAAALSDRAGSAAERIRNLSYLAIVEFRVGNLDRAVELYRAAADAAEQLKLTPLLATALLNLGTACQRQGDWGAALDHYDRAGRLCRALGRAATEATLRLNLANLHVEIGSFDRGIVAIDGGDRLAESCGLTHLRGTSLVIRGEVDLARGDVQAAARRFEDARRVHIERDAIREAAEAELHLAEAALVAGDLDGAARRWREAAERATRLEATDLLAQAALLEGRCATERGGPAQALGPLERALELCGQSGQRLLETDVHAALAAAHIALGHGDRADEHRATAQRAWERVAATLPPALRAPFWAHPRRAHLGPSADATFPPVLAPTRHVTAERTALLRFLEVNQRINSSLSVAQVLGFAMDAAIELSGAERGFVLLRRPPGEGEGARASTGGDEERGYDVAVARNIDRARVGREHYEFSTSIAERVISGDSPIVTVDAQQDERFAADGSVHAMRLQSVACVPIRSPDGVLGALYLDNRYERGRFGAADLDVLVAFANQVAIALRNARMHAELERRNEALQVDKRAAERLSQVRAKEIERLEREVATRQQALELRYSYDQIVGRSGRMRDVLATLDRVIDTPVPLLIQGESGTGKELVARAVHFHSPRRHRPFVSVNCAALPGQLLESELFGHVRGAFTGATEDKQGLMVAAHGGTLFLDEIGEAPLPMQVKLLRALQERAVRPVGATRDVAVDVRVLSATNRDLLSEVAKGTFREDLYYRLAVVVVELPPLRERSEDVPVLVRAILDRLARQQDRPPPRVTSAALGVLVRYAWPGNVRQLENVLAKAYYLSDRERIDAADVELPHSRTKPRRATDREQYARDEAKRILDALHQTRWNISTVARMLGIPRNTLYRKLQRYRIGRPEGDDAAGS